MSIFTALFILPKTKYYKLSQEKFEIAVESQNLKIPPAPQDAPFRFGFAIGYLTHKYPVAFVGVFSLQAALSILLLLLFKWIKKDKSKKNILFADPLESVKNIFSNLLLFMFGVFNRRASNQLGYYFDMSVRSRIIALMAYVLIFIAITFNYDMPEIMNRSALLLISYSQVAFITTLLFLTLFVKQFRKNYQRRLFWLSIMGLLIFWSTSGIVSMNVTQEQLQTNQHSGSYLTLINSQTIIFNILIVLAFSFYIEIVNKVTVQKARIETEVDVAQRIQKDLVPVLKIRKDTFELYGKTISASKVGGDYCDAVDLKDNRFITAVGDVSGHNVVAGVMMSMLKIAFRTELLYQTDTEQLTASLNKSIYDHKHKNMFLSLLIALLDPIERSITVVNGGHPPLIHFSAKDKSINEVRTGDIALGLQRNASFKSHTFHYKPDDIMVLLSDGLLETVNASGKELGIEPVFDTIQKHSHRSASDIYNGLLDLSKKFRGNIPQRDDITIVVIKMLNGC